jgi:hypothetical protein
MNNLKDVEVLEYTIIIKRLRSRKKIGKGSIAYTDKKFLISIWNGKPLYSGGTLYAADITKNYRASLIRMLNSIKKEIL